jgi:hypothetical protein
MGKTKRYPKPRAKKLNQREVKAFLKNTGFKTEKIIQEWRHLIAFGEYKNKPAVFKLASTKKTSRYTKNEYYWNDVIAEYSHKQNLSFKVPENYSLGEYEGLFYFICEWFFGETLDKEKKYPLEKIAQMAHEIISMPRPSVDPPNINSKRRKMPVGEKLLESATEWSSQVPRNTNGYLKIISNVKDKLKTAPAHGDFTVRAMFALKNNKIGLIDGEHYGYKGPKYYDPAWFYLRTRLEQNALPQAKEFLKIFQTFLPKPEKKIFWEELKPVLTQRFIGHLWGAKNNKEELDKLEIIGEEILTDKII